MNIQHICIRNDMKIKKFTITKKIAKHGSQAIIVIPKILQQDLKPDTIVKLQVEILMEPKNAK